MVRRLKSLLVEALSVRVDVSAIEGAWTRSHSALGCGSIDAYIQSIRSK